MNGLVNRRKKEMELFTRPYTAEQKPVVNTDAEKNG